MKFAKIVFFLLLCSIASMPRPALADGNDYVFILYNKGNPYWTAMIDGIQDTAKAKGVNAIVYQSENSTAGEEELNLCLTAIERKPKYIIMTSVNPGVAVQCFKKAVAAGITVADSDASFPVADAEKADIPLAFSVGSDNFQVGQNAAKYVQGIVTTATPKILVLEGAAGNGPGTKRVDGFRTVIAQSIPGASVTSIGAEWDRLKAMNATTDILQRQPDLDVIYAVNDVMALGAAEAVRNAGKSSQIRIVGVDGIADARKAIEDGKLTATVAQLPYLIGKRALELAVENKSTGQTETTPTPVLDKAMLTANTDPLLQYVR